MILTLVIQPEMQGLCPNCGFMVRDGGTCMRCQKGQADGLHLGLMFICFLALAACGFLGWMLYKGKTSNVQHNSFADRAQQNQKTVQYITIEKHYALLDLNPFHWGGTRVQKQQPSEIDNDLKDIPKSTTNAEVPNVVGNQSID